jgi:DNA-binding transcriptional LysR family regulator
MDLNEMLIFTRVVQGASFTAAARLLDMPKSSVSRKISDLEDRLGARLLQRTTRKLGLTDVGRIYYERCARIIGEIEEADQAVGQMQAAPCGPLRVTAPLSFSMLGPIVAEFLRRYPSVQVELVCTDRRVDLVEEGFDVAIRAGQLYDSTLVARALGNIERVLVASPAYLKEHGNPRAPADLEKHAAIAFGTGTSPTLWTLHAGDKQVEVRISPRMTVNELDLVLAATRSGVGVALMPRFVCAEDLRNGKLRQLLREWRSSTAPVHALYPTTRHLSPKVLAFVEMLRERLSTSEFTEPAEKS